MIEGEEDVRMSITLYVVITVLLIGKGEDSLVPRVFTIFTPVQCTAGRKTSDINIFSKIS